MKTQLLSLLLLLFCGHAFAQQDVELSSQWEIDNSFAINAKLNSPGTYSVAILFTKTVNVSVAPVYFATISSGTQIVRLRQAAPDGLDMDVQFIYTYVKGRSYAKIDSSFTYLLPFSPTKNVLAQDIEYLNNKQQLTEKNNWRKISFKMEKGDDICAVRKGKVIDIVNRYSPTAATTSTEPNNSILIEHSDGSLAEYAGLEKGSFTVKMNDIVYPGDPIAKAGTYDGDNYQVRLGIYFIKQNKKASDIKSTFTWIYIDPIFATPTGEIRLVDGHKYTSLVTPALVQKEMSKKEIKALGK